MAKNKYLAGFTNGALQMTRRLRMSVSQKLASWKGSTEDAKAGKNSVISAYQNLCNLFLKICAICVHSFQPRKRTSTNSYVRNYKLFLQNKANFRKSQMNVSDLLIREYEQMDTWSHGKNKAKTKPIQTQFKAKIKPIQTQFKANTNPIRTQFKPKQSQFQIQNCFKKARKSSLKIQTEMAAKGRKWDSTGFSGVTWDFGVIKGILGVFGGVKFEGG